MPLLSAAMVDPVGSIAQSYKNLRVRKISVGDGVIGKFAGNDGPLGRSCNMQSCGEAAYCGLMKNTIRRYHGTECIFSIMSMFIRQ